MVTQNIFDVESHVIFRVALSSKIGKKSLVDPFEALRVSILSLNVGQKSNQRMGFFMKDETLQSELFADVLPRPFRIVNIRQSRVVKKAGVNELSGGLWEIFIKSLART